MNRNHYAHSQQRDVGTEFGGIKALRFHTRDGKTPLCGFCRKAARETITRLRVRNGEFVEQTIPYCGEC